MTGYHLSIGYLSGESIVDDRGKAWDCLRMAVGKISQSPERLTEEAVRVQSGIDRQKCREVADAMHPDAGSNAITLINHQQQVMLTASGGGEYRPIKEAVSRAFCRLAIEELHKLGIEVNLTVA